MSRDNVIPMITGTTCPSIAELGDPSNGWAIVFAVNARTYLGRATNVDGNDACVDIACPFDYYSKRALSGEGVAARIGMVRQIFPVEHLAIASMRVRVAAIIQLHQLSPRALDSLREDLISAWEGREHLLKHGGSLAIASASTVISPP